MSKFFIPLLAFLVVGCSGTKINKEGEGEIIDYMFKFQRDLETWGKEIACDDKNYNYQIIKMTQKKLFLEDSLNKTGYLSDFVHNKVNKIRRLCGDYDVFLD